MKECLYYLQRLEPSKSPEVAIAVEAANEGVEDATNTSPYTHTSQRATLVLESTNVDDEEMPCWYYDKRELRETPSIRDGIPFETERRYRKEGARFIMTCGTEMSLGHNTMATGVVYFHRFYMFHSFRSFPRYVTACCCLFLAGKVEETPKKCRDIIKTARALLTDNYFYSFGEDPKEEVMTLERILLQTIKFDLQVDHPYTFLLKYAKCIKGDQAKLQKMVQMAWNFVNDSLSTTVCLQWEPEIIAVALIHLASKLSKFTVLDWIGRQPQHLRWWDMFVADVSMEILEDICHQVLDLYQSNQKEAASGSQSPPQNPPSRADSPTRSAFITASDLFTPSNSSHKPRTSAYPPPTATITSATAAAAAVANAGSAQSLLGASLALSNIQAIKSLSNALPHTHPSHLPPNGSGMPGGAAAYSMGAATAAPFMYPASGGPPLPPARHALPPPPHPPLYGNASTSAAAAAAAAAASANQTLGAVGQAPPPPLPPAHAGGGYIGAMPGVVGGSNTHPAPPPPLPPSAASMAPPYRAGGANTWAPPPPVPPGMPSTSHYASSAPPPPMGMSSGSGGGGSGTDTSSYYHHQQQQQQRHQQTAYGRHHRY